jgi:hypothetical protein
LVATASGEIGTVPGMKIRCWIILNIALWLSVSPIHSAESAESESNDYAPLCQAIHRAIVHELREPLEDRDNWDHKTPVLAGVRFRGSLAKPRIDKRYKDVNDGYWQRYVVSLVEPDKNLRVRIENVHSPQPGKVALSLILAVRLRCEGHAEQWNLGVKTFNASGVGNADITARVDCQFGIRLEPGKLLKGVVLEPEVTAVDLQLVDLDVQRMSRLGGTGVHELGDSFTPLVAKQLDRREAKIVAKANSVIEKHREKFRLSLEDFLSSGWSKYQATVTR